MGINRYTAAAFAAFVAAALTASGCGSFHSNIATVNIQSIEANWPEFQNDANQLQASFAAIESSKDSNATKTQELGQLQQQSKRWQDEVTSQLRATVSTIATQKHYQIVVTREGVAYGGDDITTQVEAAMSIPTSSPSPGL
jgi:Skp family chaperone for outer membrane proteins